MVVCDRERMTQACRVLLFCLATPAFVTQTCRFRFSQQPLVAAYRVAQNVSHKAVVVIASPNIDDFFKFFLLAFSAVIRLQ